MFHLWYVCYGSNMSAARLSCYLQGGRPPGGTREQVGARDASPPIEDVAVDLPGTTWFAGTSQQWGGGVALYDHTRPGCTAGRAWLLTAGQFADVAAQEAGRVPVEDDPVEALVRSPLQAGAHRLGPGRYETLLEVGRRDGRPMLTITAPYGVGQAPGTAPSAAYLATMAEGLREARGWDERQVRDYFDRLMAC